MSREGGRRRGETLSTAPPAIPELPITWEDSFASGYTVDPAVVLPLEPYDEAEQLKAPRGSELHALLEEDAAESAAHAAELARLQAELTRHTKDTTEMVKYLEAEVRRKDLMGKRMTRQLADLRSTHESELALMQKHFETTGKYMEKIFMDKERQMLALNAKLETQINDMSELATLRTSMAAELEATKKLIFANERAHKVQLDALEKRFLAARDGLQAEAAGRIAASRATYKLEVGRELEEESALVRSENESLRHQLKLHESTSDRLQKEHAALTQRIYTHKQDLELRTEQNEEYLKKAQRQNKKIEKLTQETAQMEQQLLTLLQQTEATRARTEATHSAQLEPLQQSLLAARHEAAELDARNKSLCRSARRAVGAKKELEGFFLRALEETRDTIKRRDQIQKKERNLLQAAQLRELTLPHSLRSTKLPAIGRGSEEEAAATRGSTSLFGPALALSDLTLSERSKVLRLLYAKVCHTPSGITLSLPPHSFATDDITAQQKQIAQQQQQHTAMQAQQQAQIEQANRHRIPLLALPDPAPSQAAAAAAAASSSAASPVAQLPPGSELPSAAASARESAPQLQGASYDNTFLTNFAGDDADDDDNDDEGDSDNDSTIEADDPHDVD